MMKIRFMGRSQNLNDSGYEIPEQMKIYEDTLKDVYNNTRWYLDNLESLRSYRVAWKDYKTKSCTMPYRFTKKYVGKQ